MSLFKYFANDLWQTQEIERLESKVRSLSHHSSQADAVEELRSDLARALLLLHALADTCIRKGIVSKEEIADAIEQLDNRDGTVDGKLDPASLRPPEEQDSTERYLRQLESTDAVSPQDFLANLEKEAKDES